MNWTYKYLCYFLSQRLISSFLSGWVRHEYKTRFTWMNDVIFRLFSSVWMHVGIDHLCSKSIFRQRQWFRYAIHILNNLELISYWFVLVLPDDFSINMSAFHSDRLYHEHVDYWSNVYGFEMNTITKNILADGHVMIVPAEDIVTSDCCIKVDECVHQWQSSDESTLFHLEFGRLYMFKWWYQFYTSIYTSSTEIRFHIRFCVSFRCEFFQESYRKGKLAFTISITLVAKPHLGSLFDFASISEHILETNYILSSTSIQRPRR